MKKLLVFIVLLFGVVALTIAPAKTKIKSYYSGDAINYNNRLVVASTNSESLELFVLEANNLKRVINLRPFDKRFNKDSSFYDVKLNIEDNRLYAYTISGFSIYKYDISNLREAVLIKESTNTYWEWYDRIDKFGDNIVTFSSKGIKIFNNNLEIIDSHNLVNDIPYNISLAANFILNPNEKENKIDLYDSGHREVIKSLNVNFYGAKNNRSTYYDPADQSIYFADDLSVKKIGLDGSLKARFEHIGYPGYDVDSSGNNHLYFANGLGIVKLNKADMSVLNSRRTGNITVNDGWAMGLKVVSVSGSDKVVLFNNSSLIVMNSNLEILGYFIAGLDDKKAAKENLFLNLNSASVDSGTQFQLSGGGFFPEEELVIDFYNTEKNIKADREGRFKITLNSPELSDSSSSNRVFIQSENSDGLKIKNISERSDIKVSGESSSFSYSISLEIKDLIIEKL